MDGLTFTKLNEGCTLTAKKDSRGWEIGYGHNSPSVHEGLVWTQEQADQQCEEIDYPEASGQAMVDVGQDCWETLSEVRRAALADMAYESGGQGLLEFHKMIAAIRAGNWYTACQECLQSRYAKAQVPKRAAKVASMLFHDQWP